jgi:hypothetical protein
MLINPHSIVPQFFVILGCFSQTSAPLSKSIHHKPDINITSHFTYIKVMQKKKGKRNRRSTGKETSQPCHRHRPKNPAH